MQSAAVALHRRKESHPIIVLRLPVQLPARVLVCTRNQPLLLGPGENRSKCMLVTVDRSGSKIATPGSIDRGAVGVAAGVNPGWAAGQFFKRMEDVLIGDGGNWQRAQLCLPPEQPLGREGSRPAYEFMYRSINDETVMLFAAPEIAAAWVNAALAAWRLAP